MTQDAGEGMGFQPRFSERAQGRIAKMSPSERSAATKVINRVCQDPERMTKLFTHGRRMWDGMELVDGQTYYVQAYFSITKDPNSVLIQYVAAEETHGVH